MDPFPGGVKRAELRVERSTREDGVIRLAVAGEIDMTTGDRFNDTLRQALKEPDLGQLLVDIAELQFMDSNAVAVLARTQRTAAERGIAFGIVNARGPVRHVLEMLGVYELLSADDHGIRG
jgi:anti-sigma B factor antagonist